ncbi:CLUMA_CG007834, isoform A [Clunio marinus]|uniref:CLUMA_CG007834, isoform A n=1 Tax=Clunio marinus TaxID=568069 RepID=A0A1J1I1V0_9DIPT|nr:CLUMA_CG007834, isoform A [Clunio marinus]
MMAWVLLFLLTLKFVSIRLQASDIRNTLTKWVEQLLFDQIKNEMLAVKRLLMKALENSLQFFFKIFHKIVFQHELKWKCSIQSSVFRCGLA